MTALSELLRVRLTVRAKRATLVEYGLTVALLTAVLLAGVILIGKSFGAASTDVAPSASPTATAA